MEPSIVDNPAAPVPWLRCVRSAEIRKRILHLSEDRGSARGLRAEPFLIGAFGVDDSLSFRLPPGKRTLTPQSAPPSPREGGGRPATKDDAASHFTKASTPCLAAMSERLLTALEERASTAKVDRAVAQREPCTEPIIHLELACGDCPQSGLDMLARLLLHSEAMPSLLQRCVFPALQKLLVECSPASTGKALCAWMRVLRIYAHSARVPLYDTSLKNCAFGSSASLSDAAAVLMALAAHAQPRFVQLCCGRKTMEDITQALCIRMFGRSCGKRLQSLACEAFAMGFSLWREHLAAALPQRQSGGAGRSRPTHAQSMANSVSGPPGSRHRDPGAASNGAPASVAGRPANTAGGAVASREHDRSHSPDRRSVIDEDLEWLAVQILALSQDPSLAQSCLPVMMQIGAADPVTLLVVMGKSARRTDLGPAYASSALFTLVRFIHRCSAKVLPLLPRFTEVVLRCLEPSDPTLRRQSLMAVTSALHELVQTFPMVAFHQTSQKFAVGTGDGLIVIYDLRTATKWRILEGHAGSISALAFSKDGSKLSSYSSQENSVRLWQCSAQGLLGGLLGSGGRCLKVHVLPSQAHGQESATPLPARWQTVSMAWTEQGMFRLTRERGDMAHFMPE